MATAPGGATLSCDCLLSMPSQRVPLAHNPCCSYAYGMLAAMFSAGIWLVSLQRVRSPSRCIMLWLRCCSWRPPSPSAAVCTSRACPPVQPLQHCPTDPGHLLGVARVQHPHRRGCCGGHDDGGGRPGCCQLERAHRQLPLHWGALPSIPNDALRCCCQLAKRGAAVLSSSWWCSGPPPPPAPSLASSDTRSG